MAKTWKNFECKFNTTNTSNPLPDSAYFVTEDRMVRVAYVNIDPKRKATNQTCSVTEAVCFIDGGGRLYKAIMGQAKDENITVEAVAGDTIRIRVRNYDGKGRYYIGTAQRIPANGLTTFDFANDDGVLSHVHVGHEVKNLVAGKPSEEDLKIALSRLRDAQALFNAGAPMSGISDLITR